MQVKTGNHALETVSLNRCFRGTQGVYKHHSEACNCEMTFGLFLPRRQSVDAGVVWYLSGLTCTHENAMVKSMAQAHADAAGLAVVFPDTSPRGESVPDDPDYDLGKGAGFYVNAVQEPWAAHYRMREYVENELPELLFEHFPLRRDAESICGHSMGGHGALTIALSNPDRFASVSAFAPIANPAGSAWGRKQFTEYLGKDESDWQDYDASVLLARKGYPKPILIDQGSGDQFIDLLRPHAIARQLEHMGDKHRFRMQEGFDHSYFFIMTFMRDHIAFHADALGLGF